MSNNLIIENNAFLSAAQNECFNAAKKLRKVNQAIEDNKKLTSFKGSGYTDFKTFYDSESYKTALKHEQELHKERTIRSAANIMYNERFSNILYNNILDVLKRNAEKLDGKKPYYKRVKDFLNDEIKNQCSSLYASYCIDSMYRIVVSVSYKIENKDFWISKEVSVACLKDYVFNAEAINNRNYYTIITPDEIEEKAIQFIQDLKEVEEIKNTAKSKLNMIHSRYLYTGLYDYMSTTNATAKSL